MTGAQPRIIGTTLRERTAEDVTDARLRAALANATGLLDARRETAYEQFVDPEAVRAAARTTKRDVLADLAGVLERLADRLTTLGVTVHWAQTDTDACTYVERILADAGAARIVKSKSMLTEEIGLNDVLEESGCEVTETDLGEWIIQLARETPSHIIAPAIHRDRSQVRDVLQRVADGNLSDVPEELTAFARARLRERFLVADAGISGVNFAVAETGSLVLVTNEGNGRLTTSLPRTHIAMLGMERVVETWAQLDLLLALLPRAATGQPITSYVSTITGPRRKDEHDGPEALHVVIVDNGRSDILGTEYSEMLACIRCGACLNVCPVYRQVGGHAYGWVYPGPMGAVLTPLLLEADEAAEVANASSLCGACWDACPVGIPLQDMLLALRRDAAADSGTTERLAWASWAQAWSRPWSYRTSLKLASMGARMVGDASRLPGLPQRWTTSREAPMPARRTFRDRWRDGIDDA